ncbi:hypothetical protein N0V95_007690 [Ascochyta clinopodiicola]|nr:hypothetical protein N0V95_007690 [Ascochyta clinopodiicola]
MTFFGCCCSTAWYKDNRVHNDPDNHDSAEPQQPQQSHFRDVDYGSYDGPAPATHHGDGAASSLTSQVSPRTTPTNAAGATHDASSSVYSQPTNSPTPLQSDAAPHAEQDLPTLEAPSAPGDSTGADELDEMDDGELVTAMRQALSKIAEARLAEGLGRRPGYGTE